MSTVKNSLIWKRHHPSNFMPTPCNEFLVSIEGPFWSYAKFEIRITFMSKQSNINRCKTKYFHKTNLIFFLFQVFITTWCSCWFPLLWLFRLLSAPSVPNPQDHRLLLVYSKRYAFMFFSSLVSPLEYISVTRLHFSRMRTDRDSGHLGGSVHPLCLHPPWTTPVHTRCPQPHPHTTPIHTLHPLECTMGYCQGVDRVPLTKWSFLSFIHKVIPCSLIV